MDIGWEGRFFLVCGVLVLGVVFLFYFCWLLSVSVVGVLEDIWFSMGLEGLVGIGVKKFFICLFEGFLEVFLFNLVGFFFIGC